MPNVQYYKPCGEIRSGDVPETTLDFTGQQRDGSGLLYYHARYYDSALAKFIAPDTIVPGASGGSIGPDGNVAAAGLTVSLVEDAFAGAVAEEHRGFLAKGFFDNEAKPRSGPGNPQALNRYSYVLNGPVRWVDPSGHGSCSFKGCGGEVRNFSSKSIRVLGSVIVTESECNRVNSEYAGQRCTAQDGTWVIHNASVDIEPGKTSLDYNMADVDDIVAGYDSSDDNYQAMRIGNDQEVTFGDSFTYADGLRVKIREKWRTSEDRIYYYPDPVDAVPYIAFRLYQMRNDPGPKRGRQAFLMRCSNGTYNSHCASGYST